MPHGEPTQVEVAIVGGGITGLYTAWRLATSDNGVAPESIALFEASNRTGGRIWSHRMENGSSVPAELGAMFFSDGQPIVHDLATGVFGLPTEPVQPTPRIAYVRGERFKIADLPSLDSVPYNFALDERGLSYHQLMFQALQRIVPGLGDLWPLNSESDFRETVRYLRQLRIDDVPLHRWGFWNLMARTASNESQACILDMVSIRSFLGNWNACDAILSMLRNMTGNWYKLSGGYQILPDAMVDALSRLGVSIHKNCKLTGLYDGNDPDSFRLELDCNGQPHHAECRRVVLTLPKSAYPRLATDSVIFDNLDMNKTLAAVSSVPCCKVFMTYDSPWWEHIDSGPGTVASEVLAKSHTDLPIRQCYYHATAESDESSLLMTAFCDGDAVDFWRTLIEQSNEPRDGTLSSLSRTATEEIRKQLSQMHNADVPTPREALFVDWGSENYGGGWHVWEPGVKSERIMAWLQKPDPSRAIHVCGEAFSAYQGWAEGSLSSAEAMLQAEFDLDCPDWLTSEDSLVPYESQ